MAKAGDVDYSFAKIALEVEIDGTPVEPVEVTLNYPLNGIPTAIIKLAVGSDGAGGKAMGYRKIRDAQNNQTPVKIKANFSGEEKPGKEFDNPTALMFEGMTTGPRFDAYAQQSVGLMVTAEHFVAGLDAANKISWVAHPESGFDVTATLAGAANFDVDQREVKLFEGEPVVDGANEDVWEKGIKPVFAALAEEGDAIGVSQLESLHQPNTEVLALLERINKGKGAMTATVAEGVDSDIAKRSFDEQLIDALISKDTGQTMWQTLLNFGSMWFLSVIPCFNRVLIVPFVDVVKDTSAKIELSDYWGCSMQGSMPRSPIRGVAMLTDVVSNNYSTKQYDPKDGGGGVIGVADITQFGGKPTGQMLSMYIGSMYGEFESESVAVESLPVGGQSPRWLGNMGTDPAKSVDEEMAARFEGRVMDKLAHAFLCRNRFRDRSVNIDGRLRFDIAPGSSVEVELLGDEEEKVKVFGCVTQVEYLFSSERPYATTRLAVGYLRTEADQSSPLVSSSHPLYTETFIGTSMI